jgi:23S rRNA (uracil1939-C5)-methyltransferase
MRLTIDRLGHLGDAVASGPDGPLYLKGFLPQEVIEGDDLAAMRIITPSAHRVRPPCAHAKTCGGCTLQHASYAFVSEWKQQVVQSALHNQGIEAAFLPAHISPPHSRRRAALAGRRTKGGVLIGFHARASDMLVDIPQCQLLHPDLAQAIPSLVPLVQLGATRVAEVTLHLTQSRSGLDVAVTGAKDLEASAQMELARLCESAGFARLSWNGQVVALRHMPVLRLGQALVNLPPNVFLQATADGEAALLAAVRRAIGPARRLADLFAGLGTFALPLAESAQVLAVEGDAAMIAALDQAARKTPGLHPVTAQTRDLFRRPLLADELRGFDAVVIDPPRAGAEAQVAALAASAVPRIAAVSCNPITFARDAKLLLAGGYRLDFVQLVDQFRWSHHVELAAGFSRP